MDNTAEWAPRTASIILVAVAGLLMGSGFVLLRGDVPGQALTGLAALGLLTFAAGSWRARPRLALRPEGLVSRGWFRTLTLRPTDIESVRITEFRRLGRRVRLLEIDTADDTLLVFSRWDVGGDPLDVLDALTEAGYAGR